MLACLPVNSRSSSILTIFRPAVQHCQNHRSRARDRPPSARRTTPGRACFASPAGHRCCRPTFSSQPRSKHCGRGCTQFPRPDSGYPGVGRHGQNYSSFRSPQRRRITRLSGRGLRPPTTRTCLTPALATSPSPAPATRPCFSPTTWPSSAPSLQLMYQRPRLMKSISLRRLDKGLEWVDSRDGVERIWVTHI